MVVKSWHAIVAGGGCDDSGILEPSITDSVMVARRDWKRSLFAPSTSSHTELPGPQVLNHASSASPHTNSGAGLCEMAAIDPTEEGEGEGSQKPDGESSGMIQMAAVLTGAASAGTTGMDGDCN